MTRKTQAIVALLVVGQKVTEDLVKKVIQVSDAKAPKKAAINLDEVRKVDQHGKVVQLKCSASGAWLPATEEYFYVDKKGNKDFNNLLRRSRQAEKIYKDFNKLVRDGRNKIWADFEADKIDGAQAKALTRKLPVAPDYSKVGVIKAEPQEPSKQASK